MLDRTSDFFSSQGLPCFVALKRREAHRTGQSRTPSKLSRTAASSGWADGNSSSFRHSRSTEAHVHDNYICQRPPRSRPKFKFFVSGSIPTRAESILREEPPENTNQQLASWLHHEKTHESNRGKVVYWSYAVSEVDKTIDTNNDHRLDQHRGLSNVALTYVKVREVTTFDRRMTHAGVEAGRFLNAAFHFITVASPKARSSRRSSSRWRPSTQTAAGLSGTLIS